MHPTCPTYRSTSRSSRRISSCGRLARRFTIWVGLAVLLASVPGCATYSRVGSTYRPSGTTLEVQLPAGWLRYNPARNGYVMTRDGLRLETIALSSARIGKKLPKTERVYRADMLPYELAEVSLALFAASGAAKNLRTETIELASVAGRDGYRADASYIDEHGLPKQLRIYGLIVGDHVCQMVYDAAKAVYYDKYLSTFEGLIASARVVAR
jgi:hypothetical protein